MAKFETVEAKPDGAAIRVRLRMDAPCPLDWQVLDPSTGAVLSEGEWRDASHRDVEMPVELPPEDGPYRVRIAGTENRRRLVLIDATIHEGRIGVEAARAVSASAVRRSRFLSAIPKAFSYPGRSCWVNRKLIGSMVRRDILARSRGTFGGALWAFLTPLLLMATYFFVFGVVLQASFGEDTSRTGYVLNFLAGMLAWLPFSEAVGRSPSIVVEHRNWVKKLVFPLETLPVNLVLSGLVTECFALLIFFAMLATLRGVVPVTAAWLPALLVPQLLLTAGLCWFLAGLGVFVRDLGQLIGFALTLVFFLTPICYPESQIPAAAAHLLKWNPILILVRDYRLILLQGQPPAWASLAALWIGSGAIAVLGHAWFHRLRRSFADVI